MATPVESNIDKGDVIQIWPNIEKAPKFAGKLAIVEEVRQWGVVAFVDTFEGKAYIRLTWTDFIRVGAAPFLPGDFFSETA